MDWFAENPWLAWLGLALILAAIEAATVDFVFLMLAGGAAAGAAASAVGLPVPGQVVVAVVVAGLLLLVVRPIITRKFMVAEASHGIGAHGLVGRSGRVLQAVTATDGRVKVGGETWSARIP
jgi:membrane protein implicated in regulation of membrane protease activity